MKTAKRIIALCLSFVILVCTVLCVCSLGDDPSVGFVDTTREDTYPFTFRFMRENFRYGEDEDWVEFYGPWRSAEFSNALRNHTELELYSSLWLKYYHLGDTEIWPKDFIDRFDEILSKVDNSGEYARKHRVVSSSWNGNKLTLNCSVDYDVWYDVYYGPDEHFIYTHDIYEESCYGGYDVGVVVVLFDKNDGSLINMATYYDAELGSEYHYSESTAKRIIPPEIPEHTDGQKETVTDTGTVEVQMPEFFDSDKHEIVVYFLPLPIFDYIYICDKCDNDECMYIDERNFWDPTIISEDGFEPMPPVTEPPETTTPEPEPEPNPVQGDANGDGVLNLLDVTLALKYIAEWNVTVEHSLADTNSNGRIGLDDVTFMLKRIAGWNV